MNKVKLGDVLDVKRGTSLSGDCYSTKGELVRLTLGNFKYPESGFKLNTSKDDIYFIGKVKPEYIMKKGDIITPLTEQVKGLLGNTATIPESDKYIQSGDIGKIIPNESVIDKRFSYYLVASPVVKKQLSAASQQTKIRHTSPDKIKDCIAFIPDLYQQKRIAQLLDMIDLLIQTNDSSIEQLEFIAKTIYDYWFLQFEFPNENGKPYKSSGGKMVWNDELKRKIPKGWNVQNLIHNSLCKPIKNGLKPFELKCYLPTGNINGEDIIDGDYVTPDNKESRANMQPSKYSVWFAKMKNSIKHISIPDNSDWFIDKYILSTGMEGLQCKQDTFAYVHSLINSVFFEKQKDILAHGATQESVNDQDLTNVKFVIPDDDTLKRYCTIINPYLEMKFSLFRQNQELAKLRDFLLPMLMNGQVTFKEEA